MMRNHESHKKIEDLILSARDKTDVQNVGTPPTEKGLDIQQASTNVRYVIRLATLVACATRREMDMRITKGP